MSVYIWRSWGCGRKTWQMNEACWSSPGEHGHVSALTHFIPYHATVQLLPNHQCSASAISAPTTPESSHTSSCKPVTAAITTRGSGRGPERLEPRWLQFTLS